MMGVIALFGFTLGRLYRFFLTSPKTRGVLGLGLSTAVMFVMTPIETSITKSVGGIIVSFIMAWLLVTFIIPTFARWTRA
jgi:ABC-type Fe3+-siderophore transport system permease subunit